MILWKAHVAWWGPRPDALPLVDRQLEVRASTAWHAARKAVQATRPFRTHVARVLVDLDRVGTVR